MEYNLKESGVHIQQMRKNKGYTQESFADAVGLKPASVASIESGRKGTSVDTLLVMADVLDCSVDYLVGGSTTSEAASSKELSIPREILAQQLSDAIWSVLENLYYKEG